MILISDGGQLDRIASRLFSGKTVTGQMDPGLAQRIKAVVARCPRLSGQCLLLQEFAPGNDGDHRVSVIGDRAFYFQRSNRPNDFRASGSGLISYDIDGVNRELVEKALGVSRDYGFPTMVYDYLTQPRAMLVEMNYTAVGAAIAECAGYFVEGGAFVAHDHRLPQWYQLTDFLQLPDLQPVYATD